MVEAHRRKICLSISQIKCNNEKMPSFLGMRFFTGAIFSRRHAAIFLCAPHLLFFFHTRIAGICVKLLPLLIFLPPLLQLKKKKKIKKNVPLCACVMSGALHGHSWNPETRMLLLSQQEESGLGRYKRGHSQSWWGKRVKPVQLHTRRLRGFLSSRWKRIWVFFCIRADHQQSLTWSADR